MASTETVATPSTGTNTYEAENGTLSGLTPGLILGASGNYYVSSGTGTINLSSVNGGLTSGNYAVDFRYSSYGATTPTLKVNGTTVSTGSWPASGSGLVFADKVVSSMALTSGATNTFLFTNPNLNLDKVTLLIDTPFLGYSTPWAIPAGSGSVQIEAENYDYGR